MQGSVRNRGGAKTELTIAGICQLLEAHGVERLEGSSVTLLEHALQTAWLAERATASPNLICACLLHDLGHVLAAATSGKHTNAANASISTEPRA